jgi:hypothetical protein
MGPTQTLVHKMYGYSCIMPMIIFATIDMLLVKLWMLVATLAHSLVLISFR